MTLNPIDVSSLTPSDRRQLLGWLRRKWGEDSWKTLQDNYNEESLLQLAYYSMTEDQKEGKQVDVQLSSTPRYANGAPVTDTQTSRLERLREHMGDAQYQATLKNLGQAELEKMADRMFGRTSSTSRSSAPTRTRESSQKLAQIIFFISLAYGALLGGGYPDWVRFGQVFDSIFYWVIGAVFVIGLILVLFFKTSFDFSNIWWLGFLIALAISAVIGLAANLFTVGIKVLGVAGLAFIGSWLVGVLLARPLFRLVERIDPTWLKWVIGIVGVLVLLGLLILGGVGVFAIFPMK